MNTEDLDLNLTTEEQQHPPCSPTLSPQKSEETSTPPKINGIIDEAYRAQLTDLYETPTKVTGLIYGEQLTDDLLNSFCDKVQAAVDEELEGFMAIQTVHLMPELIPSLITGTKRVLQIILDSHRKHYLLLEWNPTNKDRGVLIYDPLVKEAKDMFNVLSNSFTCQFHRLFDHLYPSNDDDDGLVPCKMESFHFAQMDNWSCGLRAAALLVLRAFNGNEFLHGGEICIDDVRFHHILTTVMSMEEKTTKEHFDIDSWFTKVSFPYKFVFSFLRKSDSQLFFRYQNCIRKHKDSYVKSDENDDIPKINEAINDSSISYDSDGSSCSSGPTSKRSLSHDEDELMDEEIPIDAPPSYYSLIVEELGDSNDFDEEYFNDLTLEEAIKQLRTTSSYLSDVKQGMVDLNKSYRKLASDYNQLYNHHIILGRNYHLAQQSANYWQNLANEERIQYQNLMKRMKELIQTESPIKEANEYLGQKFLEEFQKLQHENQLLHNLISIKDGPNLAEYVKEIEEMDSENGKQQYMSFQSPAAVVEESSELATVGNDLLTKDEEMTQEEENEKHSMIIQQALDLEEYFKPATVVTDDLKKGEEMMKQESEKQSMDLQPQVLVMEEPFQPATSMEITKL